MAETYHIRATTDDAVSLIELLKKEGAVVDLDLEPFELSESQKTAIDKELALIDAIPSYLQSWDYVRQRFKKP